MIINLKTKIRTAEGTNMQEEINNEKVDVKLSNLFFLALRTGFSEQKGDTEDTKGKDYKIEVKIILAKEGELDLELEEASRLKTVSRRIFDSFIAGQIGDILEGREIPF